MSSTGILTDFLSSILEGRVSFGWAADERSIEDLCRELLSTRGEVSSKRIGAAILNAYSNLDEDGQCAFFEFLADELDIDEEEIQAALVRYKNDKSSPNLSALINATEPPRQELFRRLNHVDGATASLVSMRADLLQIKHAHPGQMQVHNDRMHGHNQPMGVHNDPIGVQNAVQRVDIDFRHLLASWFNPGFLEIRPISWKSPANVLAKIIRYEAVHAINDWDDLRRRLQPGDRRCFAFFHPAMPDEPLVFVEVALASGTPSSIQEVLSEQRDQLDVSEADTAVFYSISNCQKGLRGVSFGNFLIKQVVEDLSRELPHLKRFVTLSPIPGFSNWLQSSQLAAEIPAEGERLKSLAAWYLANSKRGDGMPVDPVARFHLSNGAMIDDLHTDADVSEKGLEASHGVMVNYRYEVSKLEKRHEEFVKDGRIALSKSIRQLVELQANLMN